MNKINQTNKKLKSKLSKVNLRFYKDIYQYVNAHDITNHQQLLIMNEVLTEFVNIQNKDESIKESIGDPREYLDEILSKFEIRKRSFAIIVLRRYLPLWVLFACLYMLIPTILNPFPLSDIDPNLVDVQIQVVVLLAFSFIVFMFSKVDSKEKLFRIDLVASAKSLIIFFDSMLLMLLIDRFRHLFITSVLVPKVVIYLILGCAILIKIIDRKKVL